MKSQQNGYMKWILHIKNYFSKYTTLHIILNKKSLVMTKYIYMFIFHFGIPDIIQYNNKIEFKGINYYSYS